MTSYPAYWFKLVFIEASEHLTLQCVQTDKNRVTSVFMNLVYSGQERTEQPFCVCQNDHIWLCHSQFGHKAYIHISTFKLLKAIP